MSIDFLGGVLGGLGGVLGGVASASALGAQQSGMLGNMRQSPLHMQAALQNMLRSSPELQRYAERDADVAMSLWDSEFLEQTGKMVYIHPDGKLEAVNARRVRNEGPQSR